MATLSGAVASLNALPMFEFDLSSLASRAAIEIDNLILGQSKEQNSIKKLAKKLKESIHDSYSGAECRFLTNPTAVTIMGRAINKGAPNKISSVDEIIKQAQLITDILNKPMSSSDRPQLEEIRSFCIALSISAASHRVSAVDKRPKHPFRK